MPDQFFHSNVPKTPDTQLYLERPRIDHLLRKAVESPTVTVVAGTGYGKTYGVYTFLRRRKTLTSWTQCSERDNISERFWENFTAAVGEINRDTARKLEETGFPETERQFERYIRIPTEDVIPGKKYIFVYDDFHLIHNPAVLRFLERSVTSSFPNITSVFISRIEPPINLIGLLSKGRLAKITEEHLRFSPEEMNAYFALQGLDPGPQNSAAIYRDTEGWAFAIHLAGLSLKNAPPGGGYIPQAMQSNIFKLIEQEIFTAVSRDLQKYLIKLSLIEHLTPELLRTIAGNTALLDEMEQIVSFIRFDTYLNAYRIHHLFLEYLNGKQDELGAEEKQEVYLQAAAWCAENGRKMDAISYYEKAGNYDKLIALIYTLSMSMADKTTALLLDIMDRAPPQIYEEHPAAHVLYSRLLLALGRFGEASAKLWGVIKKYEALPPSPFGSRILSGCYVNLGFAGLIPCHFTRNYDWVGYFEKGRDYHLQSDDVTRGSMSSLSLGSYVCRVGSPDREEMEQFIRAITRAVPPAEACMGGCMYGVDSLARAELALYQGNLGDAEALSRGALRKAREQGQYEIETRALFFLLRICLGRGDQPGLKEVIRQFEEPLEQIEYQHRYTHHDIATGWFHVQIGQPAKLASWLKNDFEESDLNSRANGWEILVKAKYHLGENRCPAALAALESAGERTGPSVFLLGRVETLALKAVCLYQLRDKEGAYGALREAWDQAHPNGIVLPFMELGKDMRALVEAAQKDRAADIPPDWLEQVRLKASAYAKKLFALGEQFKPSELKRNTPGQGVSPLSRRELAVLTGLSQGLTREEIAKASDISVNTVKSAIRSVYNKLGAVNRADAVRIATASGLLSGGEGGDDAGTG